MCSYMSHLQNFADVFANRSVEGWRPPRFYILSLYQSFYQYLDVKQQTNKISKVGLNDLGSLFCLNDSMILNISKFEYYKLENWSAYWKWKVFCPFFLLQLRQMWFSFCTMLNISELADHDPSALCNCQKAVLALDNVESKYCTQGHSPFLCNFPENVLVHI